MRVNGLVSANNCDGDDDYNDDDDTDDGADGDNGDDDDDDDDDVWTYLAERKGLARATALSRSSSPSTPLLWYSPI